MAPRLLALAVPKPLHTAHFKGGSRPSNRERPEPGRTFPELRLEIAEKVCARATTKLKTTDFQRFVTLRQHCGAASVDNAA
jgi:hypothetical protein